MEGRFGNLRPFSAGLRGAGTLYAPAPRKTDPDFYEGQKTAEFGVHLESIEGFLLCCQSVGALALT